MIYEYLSENYDKGEPIFLSDINIEGISEDNLRYHMKKLTDDGMIERFDSGIYYIPNTDIFGRKKQLSPEAVAVAKYISRKGNRVGFFSGYTLANRMGLSTQMPFVEEITSNYAPAPLREISLKGRRYILRRPVVQVNKENVHVLQFLDCLKDIEKTAEVGADECGNILTEFAREKRITKDRIDKYIDYYPLKIYKSIYDTGVRYVSA